MGNRGNIVIIDNENHTIYLYAHSDGEELAGTLHDAIREGKSRWDDPPYFTRRIVSTLLAGAYSQETGYGISSTPLDNEHHLLVVKVDQQEVVLVHKNAHGSRGGLVDFMRNNTALGVWSYEEYLRLPRQEAINRMNAYHESNRD